jgi:hypothetical protein
VLRPQFGDFAPQAINFKLFRLHLAVAWKRSRGIACHFLHPTAQHIFMEVPVFMEVQVPSLPRDARGALTN